MKYADLYKTILQHKIMMDKEMMEVRCCCRPEKLLGWLPAPPMGAGSVTIPMKPKVPGSGFDQLVLKTEKFGNYDPDSWRTCYKAEDVPIETLRKIPAFKENFDHEN